MQQNTSSINVNSYEELVALINQPWASKPSLHIPPHVVLSLGMGGIWGWMERLRQETPAWVPQMVVDCDVYPGYVLSALRHGVKRVAFQGPPEIFQRLQTAAQSCGATLEHSVKSDYIYPHV